MSKKQRRRLAFRVFCSLTVGSLVGMITNGYREKAVENGELIGINAIDMYETIYINDDDSVYVSVPNSVRKYLIDNCLLSTELLQPGLDNVDKAITNYTLRRLKTIEVSASDTFDYSFLDYCTNLKKIVIKDPHFLTVEEEMQIEKYGLEVEIEIDSNTIDHMALMDSVHFLSFSNLNLTFGKTKEEEVEILDKYEPLLRRHLGNEKVEELKSIDKWLDEIKDSLGILPEDDEYSKVLKISYYLAKHIIYDPNVNDNMLDDDSNSLVHEYNEHPLSKLKEQTDKVGIDGLVYGICINYATLFNALCIKCGVNSIRVTGDVDYFSGHAWNKVIYTEDIKYEDALSSPLLYHEGECEEYDITNFVQNYSQVLPDLEDACFSDNETKRNNDRYVLTNILSNVTNLSLMGIETDDAYVGTAKKVERLLNADVAGERVVYTAEELKEIKNKLLESYGITGLMFLLTALSGLYLGKKLAYGIIDGPKIVDDIEQDEAKKKTLEL